ncbi:hypothetical protein H0H87_002200, partial [Tephrocybe sp. NHM501043]
FLTIHQLYPFERLSESLKEALFKRFSTIRSVEFYEDPQNASIPIGYVLCCLQLNRLSINFEHMPRDQDWDNAPTSYTSPPHKTSNGVCVLESLTHDYFHCKSPIV